MHPAAESVDDDDNDDDDDDDDDGGGELHGTSSSSRSRRAADVDTARRSTTARRCLLATDDPLDCERNGFCRCIVAVRFQIALLAQHKMPRIATDVQGAAIKYTPKKFFDNISPTIDNFKIKLNTLM